MHAGKGGQISEVGDKFPRKFGPPGAIFPRKFGPGGPNFRGGQISCDTGIYRYFDSDIPVFGICDTESL